MQSGKLGIVSATYVHVYIISVQLVVNPLFAWQVCPERTLPARACARSLTYYSGRGKFDTRIPPLVHCMGLRAATVLFFYSSSMYMCAPCQLPETAKPSHVCTHMATPYMTMTSYNSPVFIDCPMAIWLSTVKKISEYSDRGLHGTEL